MSSVDDIWDVPVAPRSPPRETANDETASRRTGSTLFLQGSDDENDQMPDAPPPRPLDIDTLFSGVDELPDQSEGDAQTPGPTPHQILSSSPAHHLDRNGEGGEKDKDGKKPKKKTMRLDEGRLIGDSGFPQLIEDTKKMKIKGKGHEASDLNRLLHVYQFWTHRLYPKTPFKDTVDRVEKLCHSKRMHNQLGIWRDEAHGIVNGEKPGEDEEDNGLIDLTDTSIPGPDSDQADYASSSSHAATRPPSSIEGDDSDVEPDADLAAQMDAAARMNARQADDQPARERPMPSQGGTAHPQAVVVQGNEEDDMWDVVDQMTNEPSTVAPQKYTSFDDEEEENWNLLDQMGTAVPKPATPDDDEENWNLLDEMDSSTIPVIVPPHAQNEMNIDGS
ncbi:replication fork protection component Swi3-domain-containing protein [Mycena crocata]|nr:replication fork protection component Swi3-domain-containing protein [Mycena crocata]